MGSGSALISTRPMHMHSRDEVPLSTQDLAWCFDESNRSVRSLLSVESIMSLFDRRHSNR